MKVKGRSGSILLVLLVALTGGILVGSLHDVPTWVALIPLLTAVGFFIVSLRQGRLHPFKATDLWNVAVAASLFLTLGIFSATVHRPSEVHFTRGTYTFSGTVAEFSPTCLGDKVLIDLSALSLLDSAGTSVPCSASNVRALVTVRNSEGIDYGSQISGLASLQPSDSPSNWLNTDYVAYLHGKKIFLTGFAEMRNCRVTPPSGSLVSVLWHLKTDLEIFIEKTRLDSNTKNFLISFLLGDKTYIRGDERLIFADAGVAHIFAVSGFHVSLVAFMILGILSLVFFGSWRKWKFLVCIPAVWFYILLVGAGPATCRAGIMFSFAMLALFLQRKSYPLLSLGWAVILILVFSPSALFEPGFQLSVICVGSLILIVTPLNFMRHREHPVLFKLVSTLLVCLVATFSVWIVCAFYFHRFSLGFLPLNLIAVPLLPVFLILAILFLICSSFGVVITPLGHLLDSAYDTFLRAAMFFSENSLTIDRFQPHILAVIIWVSALALLAWVLASKSRRKLLWVPAACFVISLVSLPVLAEEPPEGFIVQKNSRDVSLLAYNRGTESVVKMKEDNSSFVVISGLGILALRSDELSADLEKFIPQADFILLCGGCRSFPDRITELAKEGCRILTHPTIHWRTERRILEQAQTSKLPVISIRSTGPYHYFISG